MKRSIDALVSPDPVKKSRDGDLPVPPTAAEENETIERRLVNAHPTCKQTKTFLDFKQEMAFNLHVGAQDIRIQLIKTSAGVAQWKIVRGEAAWAVHHRNGMILSIGKVIEFNALLVGSHISCNIVVPGAPAFAWKLVCCVGSAHVEKTQIH